ncbi:hypothetical protein RchiOBHm_Chr7g0228761 [Rosa chinensis]|uniref:Uncharacterized protein n=1 Tax=Rosa chinensis TaxID=74649 RepID=A0A2P6PEZ2_ROSCH|nr:hypothetical protein RchiOBHm_Chr7g0228761 [Rosa chinensis]
MCQFLDISASSIQTIEEPEGSSNSCALALLPANPSVHADSKMQKQEAPF